jgi:hypothetical protein
MTNKTKLFFSSFLVNLFKTLSIKVTKIKQGEPNMPFVVPHNG